VVFDAVNQVICYFVYWHNHSYTITISQPLLPTKISFTWAHTFCGCGGNCFCSVLYWRARKRFEKGIVATEQGII